MASAASGPASTTPAADRAPRPGRFWLLLLLVALVAIGVRVVAVNAVPHTPANVYSLPTGDGFYYLEASRVLAETGEYGSVGADGAVHPDALHPPLHTTVLALGRVVGLDQVNQLRLLLCAIGVATTILVGLAGRRILSPATGIIAAGVVAISPAFWTYERNLNAEAVTFPLIAAVILLAYRYRDRPTAWRCVALGAVGGALALARTEQLLTVAFIIVTLVLTTPGPDGRGRLVRVGAAAVTALVIVAPWTAYNLGRFEHPVLLSAGSGNAMSAGACDATYDGARVGSYDEICHVGRASYVPYADRTVEDAAMRSGAIAYTRAHLGRLPFVVVAREGRTWAFFRVGDQVEEQAAAVDVPTSIVWVQTALFWLSIPLAAVGAVLLRRRRIPIYPLLAFPAVALVTVAITFGDVRYRATAEIPLVLLAAAAVVLLARRPTRSTTGPSVAEAEAGAETTPAATPGSG